jgi:hypothetical protein
LVFCIYYVLWGNEKKGSSITSTNTIRTILSGTCTFAVVVLAWIFFRAETAAKAFEYLNCLISNEFYSAETNKFLPLLLLIIPFQIFEWINRNSSNGAVLSAFSLNRYIRIAIELAIALLIIDCYYTLNHEQFIYFQF